MIFGRLFSFTALVVIGDGPERAPLEAATRGRQPAVRFTGWLPRDSVWQWVGHASLLIFPSHGPESLSRVLLEAGALGVAVAAMDTGGTGDILTHDESALLSSSAEELADHSAFVDSLDKPVWRR